MKLLISLPVVQALDIAQFLFTPKTILPNQVLSKSNMFLLLVRLMNLLSTTLKQLSLSLILLTMFVLLKSLSMLMLLAVSWLIATSNLNNTVKLM